MITPLLDFLFPRRCVGCGREGQSWICQNCRPERGEWDWSVAEGVVALAPLREPVVREALHGLKYHGLHEIADELVGLFWTEELRELLPVDTVLVPVPTSFARKKSRGFNQAELIARAISARTGFVVDNRLLKKKSKGTQVGKSKDERKKAEFTKTKVAMPEGTIVFVDDVRTTGSTLEACAEALGVGLRAVVVAQD